MCGICKTSIRGNWRVSRVKLVNRFISYGHLSWGFDAMATLEDHGKSAIVLMSAAKDGLEDHGKPVRILMSATMDGHSSFKRNKAPVKSSHRRSSEYGDDCRRERSSIEHPQRHERSARVAPLLSPSVCRLKGTLHHPNHACGSNEERENPKQNRKGE